MLLLCWYYNFLYYHKIGKESICFEITGAIVCQNTIKGVLTMPNFTDQQLNQLLQMASKKMGTTPEELKKKLMTNNVQETLKGMNQNDAQKVQQVLNNPALAKQLLNSPQAQAVLKNLMGEK